MRKGSPRYWHMTHRFTDLLRDSVKQGTSPDFVQCRKKIKLHASRFLGRLQEKAYRSSRFCGNREKNRGSIYLQKSMKRVRTSYGRNYVGRLNKKFIVCAWGLMHFRGNEILAAPLQL